MDKAKRTKASGTPGQIIGTGERVAIRELVPEDCDAFLEMVSLSRKFHHPWVSPPDTPGAFKEYFERYRSPDHKAILVCHRVEGHIFGVFNLSQIARRFFQNAYLGYYIDVRHASRGYMTDGLRLVFQHAFVEMKLHRLEANIQPDNTRSINLVKRCGFDKEGYSPKYLKIRNRWRDHERWAILVENWRAVRHAGGIRGVGRQPVAPPGSEAPTTVGG